MKDFIALCAFRGADLLLAKDSGYVGTEGQLYVEVRSYGMPAWVILSRKDEARLLRALQRRAAKRKRRGVR